MIDKRILLDYVRTITGESGQRHGVDIYFHSPLHVERTPSFVVHPSHKWYDFALSVGGDVIDLCQRVMNCDYKKAIFFLSQGNFQRHTLMPNYQESLGKEKIDVTEIYNRNLITYAIGRGVSVTILRKFCKEIHQDKYYYIGFPSANGGWELRNSMFKGCIGKKSYSHINMGSDMVMIFEGFFDFLSFVSFRSEMCNSNSVFDAIILNTTAMVPAILPLLERYRSVHAYLDNDQSGRSATSMICQVRSDLNDHSPNFSPYNDVNDYVLSLQLQKPFH